MKLRTLILALVCVLIALPAFAQGNPTGKLSGRVSSDGQALPGVTVTASSPSLQGTRTTVTSANGDYIFPSLPPGEYTVTFELEGLETVTQNVRVSAAQVVPLDVQMSLAAIEEEIVVTGSLEAISQGTQSATTYTKQLVDELPIGRTLDDVVALSPGVQPTGPAKNSGTGLGSITISGSPSYENLFMVNGVVVNENIRGQAFDLYIEDAVQETTTATAGISAEYGRFSGGVVNVITKSGGNDFTGSFRTSFTNQSWEEETPETIEQTDETIPTYEATLGGPLLRDRVWFFLAGRDRALDETRNTASFPDEGIVGSPYSFEQEQRRYEGKLTASITPSHTLLGSYIEVEQVEAGTSFSTILDLDSLYDRETPQELLALNYTGVLTDNFFVTAQYSERQFTFIGSGAPTRDLIDGTLLLDRSRGSARYHSPTFCGVCDDEERDNENLLAKASYFLSTERLGTHDISIGYDSFTDIRLANNHQSGSDYRIFGTSAIFRDGQIYPVFTGQPPTKFNTTLIQYNPILRGSEGTDFQTNSLYVNDTWRYSDRLSFNVGVRYDENDGRDAEGKLVAKDDQISPRLAVTFDPWANGNWVFHGSYGRYVAAIANGVGDNTSSAGSPATFRWNYRGPDINVAGLSDPNAPLLTADQALQELFNWFNANGGPNGSLPLILASIPGGTTIIPDTLKSPFTDEYTLGVSKRLGNRGTVRADYVHREWGDFYAERTNLSTGTVNTANGPADLTFIVNDDDVYERVYDGLHSQFRFRWTDRLDLGGNWTWSHTRGNFDGETRNSGPVAGGIGNYPEYADPSWNSPRGDLSSDLRHRANIYAVYKVLTGERQSLSVSALQAYSSGRPYEAVGIIDITPYVQNPGYETPPEEVAYYFSGRGAFTTPEVYRTDLALNYSIRLSRVEVFVAPEIINVFNEQRVDTTDGRYLNTTVNTLEEEFNPFTEEPVKGVHWEEGANFGKATNALSYQTPRTYRFSVGLRF